MSESKSIPAHTVADWKKKGFAFEPTTDAIGCTRVSLNENPFYYFRQRNVSSTSDLMHKLGQELSPTTDNCLIVAGEFSDADTFPFFLVTAEQKTEMDQQREQYYDLLELAEDKLRFFSEALLNAEEPTL